MAEAKKVDGYNLISEADIELSKALTKGKQYSEAEVGGPRRPGGRQKIGDKILVPRRLHNSLLSRNRKDSTARQTDLFREATEIVEAMLATTTSPNAKSPWRVRWSRFPGAFRVGRDAPQRPGQGVHDNRGHTGTLNR